MAVAERLRLEKTIKEDRRVTKRRGVLETHDVKDIWKPNSKDFEILSILESRISDKRRENF